MSTAMDAPEEDLDIKLQKISGDLIEDFDKSLHPFLRKQDGRGGSLVRSRVRHREADRLVTTLLEPFLELPQLLDPHLPKWLPVLADTFLEYQQTRRRSKRLSTRSELLMPLSTAICKILYTFCKIRGEKVIVRFLNNETKYLELLLSALEEAERASTASAAQWTWEERYVVLLWLSHLMLAPFDLATISSVDVEDEDLAVVEGFRWPAGLPGITTRILPLAIKYLGSAGKERDAAKALLVRISMRKDMQQLGVLDALVKWALFALRSQKDAPVGRTPYHHIGVLSYLSGILVSSSDTSDMDRYLGTLFHAVHGAAAEDDQAGAVMASALARKMVIKVIRAIAVLILRNQHQDMASMELVETTIGFLLENLADNDTPVRFAASKALSIITLKLDSEMATQVVEAVLESLNRNVLWAKNPRDPAAPATRDLSAVNPLEWHGLMLTLSHLLYRRSPPAENLSDIIHALLMGLSFERRSTSGISTGTNVRDAACFGVWALARRYTTKELLAVQPNFPSAARTSNPQASILQIVATELVVAASLDPAGNIRRGSSAALQELIGRHPDTVEKGIWVVQTVDYHAVARRSRAIQEVALSATKLSPQYGEAILDALLGWRGIGDVEAAARRVAGGSYGDITAELARGSTDPVRRLRDSVSLVLDRLRSLQARQVDERHGLLLSLAAIFDSLLPGAVNIRPDDGDAVSAELVSKFGPLALQAVTEILEDCKSQTYRRPELVAEAASRLILSSFPILSLQAAAALAADDDGRSRCLQLLPELLIPVPSSNAAKTTTTTSTPAAAAAALNKRFTSLVKSNLDVWLLRPEEEVVDAASKAAMVMLKLCDDDEAGGGREEIIKSWADSVRRRPSARAGAAATAGGLFSALVMSYSTTTALGRQIPPRGGGGEEEDRMLSCNAILERWGSDKDIDTRVSILKSLTGSDLLRENSSVFLGLIAEGLDDYTTNARGDVGSHVRLQAIKATKSLWRDFDEVVRTPPDDDRQQVVSALFLRILRLSAEKLDRVRVEAQAALALACNESYASKLRKSTFSSRPYFRFLLDLLWSRSDRLHPAISGAAAKADPERWMEELMAGYVSSADTGDENLVIASRAALTEFCERSSREDGDSKRLNAVCTALVRNLRNRHGQDRVVVPTLEVIAFLFHVGIFEGCDAVDYKNLCLLTQKAGYKTGNVRKIEACIKVYGAIAAAAGQQGDDDVSSSDVDSKKRKEEGGREARRRLGALMMHPWPRVRNLVADELWGLFIISSSSSEVGGEEEKERLKGVDWGRAEKGTIKTLVDALLH